MALLDVFKKEKEAEKLKDKQTLVKKTVDAETSTKPAKADNSQIEASEKASVFTSSKNNLPVEIEPCITEKATRLEGQGVYVFKVGNKANKLMVKRAVKEKYKVTPVSVNILNTSDKTISVRRVKGVKKGYKKAMVYLKKGDKIEI